MNLDLSQLTLESMWTLTLSLTVATAVLLYLFRHIVHLGLRTITTWRSGPLDDIYKEHGRARVWMSLLFLVINFNLLLHMLIIWASAIAWSFGFYTPSV